MGDNFHTAPTDSTTFSVVDMGPLFSQLDRGITYLKNIIVHCDGDITYTSGTLAWTDVLRVLFVRADGVTIENTIAAGNISLSDNEFAYIDLNETDATVLTVSKAAVSTGSASNFVLFNRLVLGYRNTSSDKYFPVYLQTTLPVLPVVVPEYTVVGVPSASSFDNTIIIVSDETGGRTLATSDGTNWRRVSDGAIIS